MHFVLPLSSQQSSFSIMTSPWWCLSSYRRCLFWRCGYGGYDGQPRSFGCLPSVAFMKLSLVASSPCPRVWRVGGSQDNLPFASTALPYLCITGLLVRNYSVWSGETCTGIHHSLVTFAFLSSPCTHIVS